MNYEQYVNFLKGVLIKIENAYFLLNNNPPKHILSYHKMLGVRQKISESEYKNILLPEIVIIISILNYFINGKYKEASDKMVELKVSIVKKCLEIKRNENNKN
jgi:hypothetical protein